MSDSDNEARWRVLFDMLVERDGLDLDALALLAGNLGITLMANEEVWTNAWQQHCVPDEVLIRALTSRGFNVAGHGRLWRKTGDDRRFAEGK